MKRHAAWIGAVGATLFTGTLASPAVADCPVSGPGSFSCVTQVGEFNTARVVQTGGASASVLSQQGVGNEATVVIDGDANGRRAIGARSVTIQPRNGGGSGPNGYGNASDTGDDNASGNGNDNGVGHQHPVSRTYTILVPEMSGGSVVQEGDDNVAIVGVQGDDNRYHVHQQGDGNIAVQLLRGDLNTSAARQIGDVNVALQGTRGTGNFAYLAQNGSGNWAAQVQVSYAPAVLELLGPAGVGGIQSLSSAQERARATGVATDVYEELSGGANNRSYVEQNGAGNGALLVQVGHDNIIGLAQHGDAFARIVQFGSGLNVGVNQLPGTHGTTPIIITQTGTGG